MDQINILIVDDSDINRFVIESMLTEFKVYNASGATQMYSILSEVDIDLILLDVLMPEKNGLEVATELSDSIQYKDIPIIFVSAKDSGEDILMGFNSGAFDYITKPVDERILRARIDSVLKHSKKEKTLEKQSTTDTLTSIYNRRYFMERANQEWDLVKRQNRILSIVMMDIDHFKRINDEHGHDVGDFILKETASLLTESIRLSDVLARYGGEEFITLFTGYTKEEAFLACMRIRNMINSHVFKINGLELRITMTYGIADVNDLEGSYDDHKIDDVIKLSDMRLYNGKKSGRNMVSMQV